MDTLLDNLTGLFWTVALLVLQVAIVVLCLDHSGVLAYYLPQGLGQALQHPLLYVWVLATAVIGWQLPPWLHRGYLEPNESIRLLLALGLGGASSFAWGWLFHLQSPAVWYANNVPYIRQLFRESLFHLVVTLIAISSITLALCVLGTLVGFLRERQKRRLLVPVLGGFISAGACLVFVPVFRSSLAWAVCFGLALACLLIAGTNSRAFRLPKLVSIPGPGWKDIDENNQRSTFAPILFLVAVSAPVSVLCASGAHYLSLLHSLPQSFTQIASKLPLSSLVNKQLQEYQSYEISLQEAFWGSASAFVLCALVGVLLLASQHRAFREAFIRYKTAALIGTGALILWAGTLYPYLHKSQNMLNQGHPRTLHSISQSLRSYRKDSTHSSFFEKHIGPPRTVVGNGLSHLVFFPLPLIQLGDKSIVAHLTPHHLAVGEAWKVKRYLWRALAPSMKKTNAPKAPSLSELQSHFRRLLTVTSQRSRKKATPRLLLVLHPDTPTRHLHWTLQAASQAGLKRGFVVLGTPQVWQYDESLFPFVNPVQLLPLSWKVANKVKANWKLTRQTATLQLQAKTGKTKESVQTFPLRTRKQWSQFPTNLKGLHQKQQFQGLSIQVSNDVRSVSWVRMLLVVGHLSKPHSPTLLLPLAK